MKNEIKIFYSNDWQDYELLDTGEGEKLERFGKYTFVRPYEDAVWPKTLPKKSWENIDGKFWSSKTGAKAGWKMSQSIQRSVQSRTLHTLHKDRWEMEYKGIKFLALPTPFRHLGFFPEQASHWDFIEAKILQGRTLEDSKVRPCRFLNLFGYTGVASLFALRAGGDVTHVDASKQSLAWAKDNQKLNLDVRRPSEHRTSSMRIIEDDVLKFLEREIKRGNKYDAIIMDPPKFGRGPKGEVWKIEEMLPRLLDVVSKVLSEKPLFVILTSYATDLSSLSLGYALEAMMNGRGGQTESGELCLFEKSNGRLVSLANTAVWSIY